MAWLYGRAVSDPGTSKAELNYLSVSAISTADPAESGCLRKWHYEKVLGKKRPESRATKRGNDLHSEIEKYLKTGNRSLSSLTLSGLHFVPEPAKVLPDGSLDLLIEHDLLRRPGDPEPKDEIEAAALLARAPMDIDGVRLLGRLDLVHGRCTNKGASNINETIDPPGTVEVFDWKSTGSPDWIKPAVQLPRLVQTASYTEWVFRVLPATKQVRLSHGYFVERGGPSRKVSLRVVREDVQPKLQAAAAVVRSIRHAAREANPDRVDANTDACKAYGGCPHREYCRAGMQQSLASFVGRTEAEKLLSKSQPQENNVMGLLENLTAKKAGSTPEAATNLPLAPAAQPDLEAEKRRLEAEEAAARAARELKQVAGMLERIEAFADANQQTTAFGALGTPAYGQPISKIVAAAKGRELGDNGGYSGTGALGQKFTVTSAEMMADLIKQLEGLAAEGHIKLPAEKTEKPATPPPSGLNALLSPETPASTNIPPPAAAAPTTTPPANTTPPTEEKTAPAKKPRNTKKTETTSTATADAGSGVTAQSDSISAFTLYVDCEFDVPGEQPKSLQHWVQQICADLSIAQDSADVRCGKDGSALAFGKWKGAVAAVARERAQAENLRGPHYLSTRGAEQVEIVADALRERCHKTGGAFVWGRR